MTSEEQQTGRLKTNVLLTVGNKALVLAATMGSSVIIARALGPAGRGDWAVAMALALTLVQLGSLGIQSANPFFAARGEAPLGRIVANSVWVAGLLGGLLVLLAVGIKLFIPGLVESLAWGPLIAAAVGIPALLGAMYLQSVLLGEGRMVAYNAVESASSMLLIASLAVGALVADMTVTLALAIFAGVQYAVSLTYLVLLRRHSPPLRAPDLPLAARMFRYAARVYVSTFLTFLVLRVDVLMVNGYNGSAEAGYYSLAVGLADAMYVLPAAVAINIFPMISRGADAELTAGVFRTVSVVYGAACLVAAALAAPVIPLLYGDRFQPSVHLFYWLVPGIFALGMVTLLSYHFAGRGFPLEAMLVWFVGLGVNVAINAIFLPQGTYVASIASSVAYGLLLFLHMRMFAREIGGYRALVPRPREVIGTARGMLQRAG